jgi:Zn finger protein HypA/HybF involved in hydrogenase expression
MARYYADLGDELDEQIRRAGERGDDLAKFAVRRESLQREEQFRVAELRQKSALRVHLKLIQVLVVRQPKLLIRAQAVSPRKSAATSELELVWDPLMESLEAASCPKCGSPTMTFQHDRQNRLACPQCAGAGSAVSSGPARRAK